MAHYQCYKCSAIMVAEQTPARCERCGALAAEAFPGGVGVEDPNELAPVDHLFDVTLGSGTGLSPVATQELDEEDVLESEPAAPRLVTPSSRVPPPPTPLEASPVKPMAGRVAYPLPPKHAPEREQEPPSQVEDEMAVAGLPPVPPRPQPVLASQTESLAARRARRVRQTVRRVMLAAGGALLVLALGFALWPRREASRVSGEKGDAGRAPDAARPDAGGPDLTPLDARRPDLQRPDLRRPDLRPGVDQRASLRPTHPARPAKPAAPRPVVAPRPPQTAVPPGPDAAPQQPPQAHYRAGLRLLLRGQLDAAVVRFNAALDGDPRLSLAYRGLGLAYQKQGRRAKALEAFKRYLRIRPDAPDAAAVRKRIKELGP